jgi:hypothetical protein
MRLGGGILGGFALAFGPSVAGAQAVETSLRPVLRPAAIEARFTNTVAPITSLRPKVRPTRTRSATGSAVEKVVVEQTIAADINAQKVTKTSPLKNVVVRTETGVVTATSPFAVRTSLRPKKRPRKLKTALLDTSKPGRAQKAVRYKKMGSVCGINGLRGYSVKRIVGKGGCGVKNPVKLTEVDGVKMTREVSIGCNTVKAFYSWMQKSAKPAVGRKGGGLAKVQIIGGYACWNRNSAKTGRLSEHAKGNALDIAGFVLKDGTTLSVLRDWRSRSKGPTLKRLHKTACGPFKNVLGPDANRFHQDHFHFDVAQHRGGGTYCKLTA